MTRRSIRSVISLLSTEEGGRTTDIRSGYRSLLRFSGTTNDIGYELTLDDVALAPGGKGTATLTFWAGDLLPALFNGQIFDLREGTKIIGYGEILEIHR